MSSLVCMKFSGEFWDFCRGTLSPAANRLFYAAHSFQANGELGNCRRFGV
jgi:hypothetical protein